MWLFTLPPTLVSIGVRESVNTATPPVTEVAANPVHLDPHAERIAALSASLSLRIGVFHKTKQKVVVELLLLLGAQWKVASAWVEQRWSGNGK